MGMRIFSIQSHLDFPGNCNFSQLVIPGQQTITAAISPIRISHLHFQAHFQTFANQGGNALELLR